MASSHVEKPLHSLSKDELKELADLYAEILVEKTEVDGIEVGRCWDRYGRAVMPLYDYKIRHCHITEKDPAVCFSSCIPQVLKIEPVDCEKEKIGYITSIKHMLKTKEQVEKELIHNKPMRKVLQLIAKKRKKIDKDYEIMLAAEAKTENAKLINKKAQFNEKGVQSFIFVHILKELVLSGDITSGINLQCPCNECSEIWLKGNTCIGNPKKTFYGIIDAISGRTAIKLLAEADEEPGDAGECTIYDIVEKDEKSQATAEVFTFSFTETNRHPNKELPIPKNILIDRDRLKVFFYDCSGDILLVSLTYKIFNENSILLLGILLNMNLFYRNPDLSRCTKSGFIKKISDLNLLNYYKDLNSYRRTISKCNSDNDDKLCSSPRNEEPDDLSSSHRSDEPNDLTLYPRSDGPSSPKKTRTY